ncbi:MAG: hypothetical protein IRD7MM_06105 [Candidatus Midichloria mitochondrii]|uniref:Uncharacterized protein n=1 Tax=Midichloria mitochondrii (strain IricVA) TaxID=696127 RepID=F7XU65_MIDMI|nr:hypothetical protein [Candidatus Midichloria mitochondrii]AEI89424.1 hypothetical protein midi_01148 [Candidatus Midichloria mitochondrii IricVA]MDJ1256465.1 hypothetical protein [Candidatus Midichloria mitochondrii]MDJ1288169.1 hypothetical protein [Candidatus Midichloria mitochondrii]MDJ1299053.1 hypothetical protein [Candidatus Midichloria mitochondrii]MDJ1313223.1 hypothetical protein [Candidatus Midichloria mitochondrii]
MHRGRAQRAPPGDLNDPNLPGAHRQPGWDSAQYDVHTYEEVDKTLGNLDATLNKLHYKEAYVSVVDDDNYITPIMDLITKWRVANSLPMQEQTIIPASHKQLVPLLHSLIIPPATHCSSATSCS